MALPWALGNSLTAMATIARATGDPVHAERLLHEATSVLRDAGPWFRSLILYIRAILAVRRGHADEAISLVRESLTHIRELHDKYAFVYALVPLAAAVVLKGNDVWAARILGVRGAVSERTGATMVSRKSLDELTAVTERDVRARLGPDRWAAAYAAGREMSIDSLLKDIDRAFERH
jgi:ATP/maltotriose-dependent transcriptional regulator MalT